MLDDDNGIAEISQLRFRQPVAHGDRTPASGGIRVIDKETLELVFGL